SVYVLLAGFESPFGFNNNALEFALYWGAIATVQACCVVFKLGLKFFRRQSHTVDTRTEPTFEADQIPDAIPVNSNDNTSPQRSAQFRMNDVLKKCMWALVGVFCISFITNMLMLTGPLFMLQIYDRVLTSRSIPTLTVLLMLVAGLFLFLGILELLRSRILVRIGQRIDRHINDPIFKSSVSASSPDERQYKRNLLQDLNSVRQFFGNSAPTSIFDLPWTPIYFAVIFLFHPALGLLAIGGAAFLFVISMYNEFATKTSVMRADQLSTQSSALAESGRRNVEALHAMGMFEAFQSRWLRIHRDSISHQLAAADVSGTMSVMSKVSRLFLQSLMLAAGGYYAVIGEISAGVIVAASIILSRALAPIEQIVGQWRNIITVRHAFGRLRKTVDGMAVEERRIRLPTPQGFLSTERLYAGPLGSREPILKDLNFHVRPGDALAVVGSNASGKSTLARVLVGVWPTLRGDVRLDGAALPQWLPEQLGKSVGYLPQDVELFDGTVAENISRFDPTGTPDMILEAAKKSHVHNLIIRLPEGYATKLGETGISISGGQRQRIALARALYGNPSLVVLDEPNANLDNEGELALTAAIKALREEGCSVIVMAHRPNILTAVNLVMVLKEGRQVSFGDKSKVLKKNVMQVDPKTVRRKNVATS
ncbi:MAG: type I secretion system permease/ATPase, partial [Pseudomonadota bacterium]